MLSNVFTRTTQNCRWESKNSIVPKENHVKVLDILNIKLLFRSSISTFECMLEKANKKIETFDPSVFTVPQLPIS